MNARLFLAEDDVDLAQGLTSSLRQTGYAVDWAVNGDEADRVLREQAFDLVILDLSLPGKGGLEVLSALRGRKCATPVLILSARDELSDRVRGLDLGADDYLTKPFELDELEARARALLRRSQARSAHVEIGGVTLDPAARCVSANGVALELTAREYALLELLMLSAGQVVSKSQISERLCAPGEEMSAGAIETLVHRVRRRIEGCPVDLRTLRGFGYLLEAARLA
ncbi:MAG: response regulator transcription factor [Zoogloeaceae bacterium]|nr:response regulator transcription factor [Zoogloeaceae bacterium]